jgi:Mg-chelatase subunit ChlI
MNLNVIQGARGTSKTILAKALKNLLTEYEVYPLFQQAEIETHL